MFEETFVRRECRSVCAEPRRPLALGDAIFERRASRSSSWPGFARRDATPVNVCARRQGPKNACHGPPTSSAVTTVRIPSFVFKLRRESAMLQFRLAESHFVFV